MTGVAQLPFAQAHPLQFAPLLRELQNRGVIHRVRTALGDPAWLVTDHAEVMRLLDDDRLGLAHRSPETAARMHQSALFGGPIPNFATEHTDHARKRALLQPHFTPNHLQALRPRVAALTTELLDDLAAKGTPADLYTAVALPLPILVLCELLGVPGDDRERFRALTVDAANTRDRARSEHGLRGLLDYSRQLVARKRSAPADDVISRLCTVEGLSDDEAADLAMVLLWAGHETTVAQIGLGALLLLEHPDQWHVLADDSDLAPSAVEEILRTARRRGGAIPRYARTDVQIGEATVHAGELVLLGITAANHDPAIFADPDCVDIHRPASRHLTFGHGARYCIGAALARIELAAVFSQLAPRFPTMRLAVPVEELSLRTDLLFGGLSELPVQWSP
ncbi:MAG: cytochrome P450 [Mycobacterium sp.]